MTTERRRRRAGHPLLGRFPLAVMSAATFVVIFALLMARTPHTASLQARVSAGQLSAGGQAGTAGARTRTSGGAAAPATAGPNGVVAPATSPVVARASGAVAGEGDDG